MQLIKVGFFRELAHGSKTGLSLSESIRDKSHQEEEKIIKYLNEGTLFIACPGVTKDVLNELRGIIGAPHIYTDGVWAWCGDLSYYVKEYHIELPEKFIENMRKNNWTVPSRTASEVEEFEL